MHYIDWIMSDCINALLVTNMYNNNKEHIAWIYLVVLEDCIEGWMENCFNCPFKCIHSYNSFPYNPRYPICTFSCYELTWLNGLFAFCFLYVLQEETPQGFFEDHGLGWWEKWRMAAFIHHTIPLLTNRSTLTKNRHWKKDWTVETVESLYYY